MNNLAENTGEKMSETKKLTTAIIISLVAGILIILGNLYIWTILGIVSGIIVLISAIMLKIRPGEGTRGLRVCCIAWGSMILIFSIVSLFAGSVGGYIGAILGIVGAALALVVKV
jgi:hypothetical protein